MNESLINNMMKLLGKATDDFTAYLPKLESQIADNIENSMSSLNKDSRGALKPTKANFKKLLSIKSDLENCLSDTDYVQQSGKYIGAYMSFADLCNQYFISLSTKYKPTDAMNAVKETAIDATIENFGKIGMMNAVNASLTTPVLNHLTNSMATGMPYLNAVKGMRLIATGGKGEGPFERYGKTIVIDSLNTFAANYINAGSIGFGLNWFMYVGAIIKTSRCWCISTKKIQYVHRSEFQRLIDMDFPEYDDCDINDKTGLPRGMKEGTNASNLISNRGGWWCNHQLIPVPENFVPQEAKLRIA